MYVSLTAFSSTLLYKKIHNLDELYCLKALVACKPLSLAQLAHSSVWPWKKGKSHVSHD